jgi:hypothetical protein
MANRFTHVTKDCPMVVPRMIHAESTRSPFIPCSARRGEHADAKPLSFVAAPLRGVEVK